MRPPGMEQNMKQNMVATAAMQLFMRALAATNTELRQQVAQAIAVNPALEDGSDDFPTEEHSSGEISAYKDSFRLDSLTETPSLLSHLEEQIRHSGLPEATENAALLLVQHLSPRGYFEEPPADIAEREGIRKKHLQAALSAIQDLDPPGVGACDLRESLMLQLRHLGEEDGLPMQLLLHHWDALVRHRYSLAAAELGITEHRVADAAARIARLNPNPGAGFLPSENENIQPDVVVEQDGDTLQVRLTGENIPKLALSAAYREMMAEKADKPEVRRYLSHCFREGRELIRAIEQRQQTILTVSRAIISRQRDFFLRGSRHLHPLKREDIAAETGLHVSTISRAVKGKYLRFGHRLYELSSFFSTALPAEEGAEHSAAAVRARIRELIDAEEGQHPLSDAGLEAALAQEGIRVARRTIAKYREQLKILPAHLRRR